MCHYVVDHDKKTITKCESRDQAQSMCILALTKSRSLSVFFYNEIDFRKLELNKAEYTELTMDDANDEFLIQSANSANHEGVTVNLAETNQRFRLRQNSDFLAFYCSTSDSYIRPSDGNLILQTDEATNTATVVSIKPKGSSEVSELELYDTDAERLSLYTAADRAYIKSSNALGLQVDQVQDVNFWESIASGNPSINIYGWNTAGSDLESTELTMDDANDEFLIQAANSANHEGVTVSLPEANQAFRMRGNGGLAFVMSNSGAITTGTYSATINKINPRF